jgi:glycosyltransferase involved in cell wall biosynthesis
MLAGVPVRICTVHSSYRLEHDNSLKGWLYEKVLFLNRLMGCRFIAVSESVYTYLRKFVGVSSKKILLIYNSISPSISIMQRSDHNLLQSLGWEDGVYVIIVVARLEAVKGHIFLFQALQQILKKQPHVRCLIVGNGRMNIVLKAKAQEFNLQNVVYFAGFRNDISELMNSSNAFCLPSLSEGLPYAILEACLHRLPLLVTSVGDMSKILTHMQTAFIVPPSRADALAEGICWLISHQQEATNMAQRAHDLVLKQFSIDAMIAKTLEMYQINVSE